MLYEIEMLFDGAWVGQGSFNSLKQAKEALDNSSWWVHKYDMRVVDKCTKQVVYQQGAIEAS